MKPQTSALFRLLLLLSLFAMLAACGDDSVAPDPDPTVTGSWIGTTGTTTLLLTMNQQPDGSVSGSGSIADVTTIALTISAGTQVFPNLSLTLTATGLQDLNLTGTVTSSTAIAARLNGSGYSNENINLSKQ